MKIKEISAKSGLTLIIKEKYYKFETSIIAELEEKDNLEKNQKKLFEKCNNIIDLQVEEVLNSYKE